MNIDKIENYDYSKLIERISDIETDKGYRISKISKSLKVLYILLNSNATNEKEIDFLREEYKFKAYDLNAALKSVSAEKIFTIEELHIIGNIIKEYKKKYGMCDTSQNLKSINTIKDFINGGYISVDQYCKDTGISYQKFQQAIASVKVDDVNLYNYFYDYITRVQKDNYLTIKNMWEEIKIKIINGIELNNGSNRQFDLLDYFEITNLLPNDFYIIMTEKKIENDTFALRKFKTFVNNCLLDHILRPEQIELFYKQVYQYNLKKDENGNLIPNSGNIISYDDKVNIIEYLRSNNIPLYNRVLLIALSRFKKETLNTDYVSSKKLVFKH